jgi:hypothetical protein
MNFPLVINEESIILNILNDIPYQGIHEHAITKNIHNNFRTTKRLKSEIRNDGLYRYVLPEEGFLEGILLLSVSLVLLLLVLLLKNVPDAVYLKIFILNKDLKNYVNLIHPTFSQESIKNLSKNKKITLN